MKLTTGVMKKWALKQPDVVTGLACAGTKVESVTYGTGKQGKKVFLFVREVPAGLELRFKLDASKDELAKLSKKNPGLSVGAGGWAKVTLADDDALPSGALPKWIAESHALMAS